MHTTSKKPAAGLAKDDEDVRVQSTNDEATIARACVSLPHHHHRTPFFLFPLFSLSSRNFWKLSAARVKVNLLSNCFSLSLLALVNDDDDDEQQFVRDRGSLPERHLVCIIRQQETRSQKRTVAQLGHILPSRARAESDRDVFDDGPRGDW
jgi:hypothetical protein